MYFENSSPTISVPTKVISPSPSFPLTPIAYKMFCCFSIRLFSSILGLKDEAVNANNDPTTTTMAIAKIIVYEFLSVLTAIIKLF